MRRPLVAGALGLVALLHSAPSGLARSGALAGAPPGRAPAVAPQTLAAPPCGTAAYLAALQPALAALRATPPDIAAALQALSAPGARAGREALAPAVAALERTPSDPAGAARRLEAAISVLQPPPRAVCAVDDRPARGALTRVYASRVFAGLDSETRPSPLQQLLRWFLEHAGVPEAPGWLPDLLLAGLLTALAVAIAAAVRARSRTPASPPPVVSRSAAESDRRTAAAEWSAALAAAGRGDHREAVRRAFRSALAALAGSGRLTVRPSWTTAQLLGSAGGDADLIGTLAPAAALFERSWYSGRPVSPADWQQARTLCERLRSLPPSQRSRRE